MQPPFMACGPNRPFLWDYYSNYCHEYREFGKPLNQSFRMNSRVLDIHSCRIILNRRTDREPLDARKESVNSRDENSTLLAHLQLGFPNFASVWIISEDQNGRGTILHGAVINPVSLTSYSILPQCMLSIDPSGKIEWIID